MSREQRRLQKDCLFQHRSLSQSVQELKTLPYSPFNDNAHLVQTLA
jgi:hypothetical protein